MATPEFERGGLVNFLLDLPVRGFFGLLSLLPYRARLRAAGSVAAHVLAPLFGANRRIVKNLAHVWPDLDRATARRLCHEVSDNSARLMVESFSTRDFLKHARAARLGGDGKETLLHALSANRPVVLVTGHFGNYQVLRVLLMERGFATAAIYRPMNNAYTNARYIRHMNELAGPNLPRGMKGTRAMLSHLKKGGAVLLLNDQAAFEGKKLRFLGKPALTMTSAAEFALRFDALLIPYYGIRQKNGVDFDVVIEPPIPHSSPIGMSQALNDSLERMVKAHPGQWFWIHRRWKGL